MPATAEHSFDALMRRLRKLQFAETFDMIVAIANGGLLPAALLHERLGIEINVLQINWRDPENVPRHPRPVLLRPLDFATSGKKILLADDRIKTGGTIAFAKEILADAALIKTFAINGNADYAIWNEPCFAFPWRL
jgi:xanthine phosphoribosyltransferase